MGNVAFNAFDNYASDVGLNRIHFWNSTDGFFSDAYHLEWVYPKLKLVKQILGSILEERVDNGWYNLETATRIIRTILYDSPKKIFDLTKKH